jgi:hypothetical protein
MKKGRVTKIALMLLSVVMMAFFVVSVASWLFPELTEPLMALIGHGSSGVVLANTAIPGTQTFEKTDAASPGHIKRSVSQVVTEIRPDAYPLDTMLRNIRQSEKIANVKHEYETVKYRERVSALTAGFTAAGAAGDETVVLTINNVRIWAVDDTAYVPTINGASSQPLRLLVMAVNRALNQITVTAINSPTADTQRVPTIANNTKLYRMGNAKNELDSITDIIAMEPTQEFNFCQIQMAFLEESVLSSLMTTESGYDYKDKYLQQIYDMRSSCEFTHLYGKRSKTINKITDKTHYTADGIRAKITNTHTFVGNATTVEAISKKDVTSLLEKVFSGNDGSEERLLLGGSTLIRHLQNISLNKEIGPTEIKAVHGVKVQRLETDFGVLNIKHSKAMDEFGDSEVGLVLDLKHIYKHDLEKLSTEKLDPDKAGLRRVKNAYRMLENSCVTTRYPDVHYVWRRDAANAIV